MTLLDPQKLPPPFTRYGQRRGRTTTWTPFRVVKMRTGACIYECRSENGVKSFFHESECVNRSWAS